MPQADFSIKMNDEVACNLKELAEVARSDKQNTTEMDLNEIYSTARNPFKTGYGPSNISLLHSFHFVAEVSVDNAKSFRAWCQETGICK